MALGEYKDVYNLVSYQQRVEAISSAISKEKNYMAGVNEKAKGALRDQIAMLKEKEKRIYQILNCSSLTELRNRIKSFQDSYFPLSGPQLLEACVAPYSLSVDKTNIQLQKEVTALTRELLAENVRELAETSLDDIHTILMRELNKGGNHFYSKKGYSDGGAPNISLMTKNQRERFNEILNQKKYSHIRGNAELQFDDDSYVFGYEWYINTQGLTKSKAKEIFGNDKAQLDQINNNILNRILNYCGADRELIRDIIVNKVLREDRYAFFVGENEKDITGLLGEIQAIYYISKLTDDKKVNISWQGGIPEDGKKPHRDVLLNNIGIQVKNTTKDLTKGMLEVNFATASIDNMLSRTTLSSSVKNLIKNYYSTKMFNVPYVKEGKSFKEEESSQNKEFRDVKTQLENYNSQIEQLLEIFAATFMYIDVNKNFNKGIDLNSLYILGASTVVVASEILSDILEQLEKGEKRFQVVGEPKQSRTIVDILNSSPQERAALLKRTEAKTISSAITANILLTSSFVFKIPE